MRKLKMTVAMYIEQQLALCDRPQKDVAADCGYENANVIAMFKSGTTKVPIAKVKVLAAALRVDVTYLFRLVMQEYQPEGWAAMVSIFGRDKFITSNEMALVRFVRKFAGGDCIDLTDRNNTLELQVVIEDCAAHDLGKAEAAVAALNRLPSNGRHKS